jgi:hypothetical protein
MLRLSRMGPFARAKKSRPDNQAARQSSPPPRAAQANNIIICRSSSQAVQVIEDRISILDGPAKIEARGGQSLQDRSKRHRPG